MVPELFEPDVGFVEDMFGSDLHEVSEAGAKVKSERI